MVPPILILSVTGRCNLECTGCCARTQGRPEEPEMGSDRLSSLVGEASLSEALESPLLAEIRRNMGRLDDSSGGARSELDKSGNIRII